MKIGRNDPCPCGSGKKYKKCCGKNSNVVSLNQVQVEKEKDTFFESFFSYLFKNWNEDILDEYIEIKSDPKDSLEEVLRDYDYAILSEGFAFHNKVEAGVTPFKLFLNKEDKNFRSATINHFQRLLKMYYSLYEVMEVASDEIVLQDIFLNKIHTVKNEDFMDDVKKGDILFSQLTNNAGLQEILFNYINLKDFADPFVDMFYDLFAQSKVEDFEEFLKENSYYIVRSVLALSDQLDNPDYDLLYGSLYVFAINWLTTPLEFLNDISPVEAFQTTQGKAKVVSYLNDLHDPALGDEEKELLAGSKDIIQEHLGLIPGKIVDVDQYDWQKPSYEEVATRIIDDFSGVFTPFQISNAIKMWFDYTLKRKPRIVKANTWVAVINYALLQIEFAHSPTQKEVAQRYSVSSSTLGKNYRQLKEVLDLEDYRTAKFPIPPIFNDMLSFALHSNKADELIDQAFEAKDTDRRVSLAWQALGSDPNCVDAYVILGNESGYWDDAQKYYALGVQAGEKVLGEDYFKENKGHFWGLHETRPYMQAKLGLAQASWELGERQEAVKHMLEILELNPNDNQGVRYILSGYLLLMDEDEKFEKLYEQYADDVGIHFRYNYALFLFKKHGDIEVSREALKEAMTYNKYVSPYLIDESKMPKGMPLYYSLGSEEEAVTYVVEARDVWKETPGAIGWSQRCLWLC